MKTKLKR